MNKILIIEDEYNDFENIKHILINNFSQIDVLKIPDLELDNIKKGKDISEYLTISKFDLIILDVGLTGRSGLESDISGKNLYNTFSDDIKKITLFVSQIDANNLTNEMKKKFFSKNNLESNQKFINYVSNKLAINKIGSTESQNLVSEGRKTSLKISNIITYSSLVLMLFVIIYVLLFLILKVKYLLEGNYKTEDIVHFVESFFLVALPIFMSYAIFIFAKKIVGAIADGNLPESGTINDSVKIIGMVKNLFIGSIISYISLTLITNLFDPSTNVNVNGYLIALGVIIILVFYWKILSKH